jgi:predicted nuclease of predicted toxin-antitoxin system
MQVKSWKKNRFSYRLREVLILADENIAGVFVAALRKHGNDVEWIKELNPSAPDEWVLERAISTRRLLVTTDIELASTSLQLGKDTSGTVLLRHFDKPTIHQAEGLALELERRTDWHSRHTVVTPEKVRTRLFVVT